MQGMLVLTGQSLDLLPVFPATRNTVSFCLPALSDCNAANCAGHKITKTQCLHPPPWHGHDGYSAGQEIPCHYGTLRIITLLTLAWQWT